MRTLVLAILVSAGFIPRTADLNLDFESAALGGWRTNGVEATLVEQDCPQGRQCVMLSGASGLMYEAIAPPRPVARNTKPQSGLTLAAGRRVRFRAAVRVEGASARLWVRADGGAGAGPYRKSLAITGAEWNYYEIETEIGEDAHEILFGFLLDGPGKVWVDDASFVEVRRTPARAAIMKA
jgi:hypothetical protein